MRDVEKARQLLATGVYTCVLVKGTEVYTSTLTGVGPMLDFLERGVELRGFSAADKIVGKAAALLFTLAGVRAVYAELLSEKGAEVLMTAGIVYEYNKLTDIIINRMGTGPCPMEETVAAIAEPAAAFIALKARQESLRKRGVLGNSYTIIDEAHWPRAMHCNIFRNSLEPSFCVTCDIEISAFLSMVRSKHYSFTMAMIYLVAQCANEIAEFRYRFVDGKVALFEHIDTAFTYLDKETELFKVVNVPLTGSMEEYVHQASRVAKEQKAYFTGPLGNDVFQFSPLPWVQYTHISHTNSGKKNNATPLFDWGKYYIREGRTYLPFSIQAHHSFVDGLHVGMLIDKVQKRLEGYQ